MEGVNGTAAAQGFVHSFMRQKAPPPPHAHPHDAPSAQPRVPSLCDNGGGAHGLGGLGIASASRVSARLHQCTA